MQTGFCFSGPTTPRCNPINYLDAAPSGDDNADLMQRFSTGIFSDATGNIRFNDIAVAVTYGDVMPNVQRRVALEALYSLTSYATQAGNHNQYPWASSATSQAGPTSFNAT